MNKEIKSYGTWPSKITADSLAKDAVKLSFPKVHGNDVYWLEGRPSEKGRSVVVKNGEDLFSSEYSATTKAHEYGGDSFLVTEIGVFFSNQKDQRLYHIRDGKITPITSPGPFRYADGVFDPKRELLYYIREEHGEEVENSVVKINPHTGECEEIAGGHDFYSNPRISPDGKKLCYLCWDHPHMPWEEARLMVHEINQEGGLHDGDCIGEENESIFCPRFAPDSVLYFVSDRSGYWNLYRIQDQKIQPLHPMEAEFGIPQWIFGFSTYDFLIHEDGHDLICAFIEEGKSSLAKLSLRDFSFTRFDIPWNTFQDLFVAGNRVYFTSGTPETPKELVSFDIDSEKAEIIRKSTKMKFEEGSISVGQTFSFPTENDDMAYGIFYPPVHPHYHGPESERPPLIVKVHGGPTNMVNNALNLQIQFWTSRGFAFAEVNYGGSTGFGKAYRKRLDGKLGIVDVNDCANCVLYLAKEGLIDADRTAIQGGSSGGYTVLAALCFRDVFQVGVSSYGISDLEVLAHDTHKFEKHYTDTLIGPYPEMKSTYQERSPIHHISRIKAPILFLQGSEDKVVPPNQSEMMYEALKKRDIPTKYILFEGEGHGFRSSGAIKRSIEEMLEFYQEIFGVCL